MKIKQCDDRLFLAVMVDKRCIPLGYTTNEVLGYEGEIRSQQQSMKKFLKSNGVQLLEIHSNDERVKIIPQLYRKYLNYLIRAPLQRRNG